MNGEKTMKKTEANTAKKTETASRPAKTRYYIGKEIEITEAQAKEHIKKQNEKGIRK